MFVKFKLEFNFHLENTISKIEIKFLFLKYKRIGSFKLKKKEHNQNYDENLNNNTNKKSKKNKSKSNNIKLWFFRRIRYEYLTIYEKIGLLNPILTANALPIISTATMIPLNFFNINYKNLKYEIIPDYNNFIFVLDLKSKASFRLINLVIKGRF